MKNVLICLEQLGIGGVETFTITQVEEFNRRGIKCYVLSRDGILRERLNNKKNIEWIEFDFKLQDTIDYEQVKKLEKIVVSKKIDVAYVHQFPCVPYILPVLLKYKISYVAYLHNIVPKTCEWFMDTYIIYKMLFPIYFQCASKIITIADKVKKEHINLFKLPEKKYMVVNNSLNFSDYPDKKIIKINMDFDNLLLFGRMSEEKRKSINTAIRFYKYIKEKYNKNVKLTVVGDGKILPEIKSMYEKYNIEFIGEVANVRPYIEKSDVLLGVDRCMLEAVACKKPAIICGYKENINLITPSNMEDVVAANFSGINLGSNEDEIFKYSEKELISIIEENYKYVSKHLSIKNSVFLDVEKPSTKDLNLNEIIDTTNLYISKIKELEQETKRLFEENQELYSEIEINSKSILKKTINKITRKVKKVK